MKSGRNLVDLATEIARQATAKADFSAPRPKLSMSPKGELILAGRDPMAVRGLAHSQIAEYLGIPYKYYQRMQEQEPELLARNVNRWFSDKDEKLQKERRMVRTLDGQVRALLSSAYRTIENSDIAEAVLPQILDRNMLIMSCEITERRLYIKAVDRQIERSIPTGARMGDGSHHIFDTVAPALIIGNSEVGEGSSFLETGIFTKACTNMAIFAAKMRKYHIGARADISDEVYAMLTTETKRAQDAALMGQVRDVVKANFDTAAFDHNCKLLEQAADDSIPKDVDATEVIEVAAKRWGMTDGERASVLQCLIQGGDLSRYGLHSAITLASAEVDSYDRATELERIGGDVIQLPKGDWQQMLKAAA